MDPQHIGNVDIKSYKYTSSPSILLSISHLSDQVVLTRYHRAPETTGAGLSLYRHGAVDRNLLGTQLDHLKSCSRLKRQLIVNRSVSTRRTLERNQRRVSGKQPTSLYSCRAPTSSFANISIDPTPFTMNHSAIWRAGDPGPPGARKSTQCGGTIDNVCLQGSHPYNCGLSLTRPGNVSHVHLPTPSTGRSFREDLPRSMSGPSDPSIAIPGFSSKQLQNVPCQADTDHGRFWNERSRSHARMADDQILLGRKSSTPSGYPHRLQLPPIQTLRTSAPLLREPAGFRAYFSVNAPPPQLSTDPRSWHYVYVPSISQRLR